MTFVDFEPIGRRGECAPDQTLLDCARQLGVDLVNLCGGAGTCGRCKVQLLEGDLSELAEKEASLLSADQIEAGFRLACRALPRGDCKLRVPPESLTTPQRTQIEGLEVPVEPDPAVQVAIISVPPASLDDLRADDHRLRDALETQGVRVATMDLDGLRALPDVLRQNDWTAVAVVRGDAVIGALAPGGRPLGLAVDLGTTKIAGYLMDLTDGRTLAAQGTMNPQISFGEDVIARMDYALRGGAEAAQMQHLVVEALNQLAAEMCQDAMVDLAHILEVVVVANTAMHHLLLRLPVRQLATAPYVPAVARAQELQAGRIGLSFAPGAVLHLLPNIAGYVGADHVAMILATGLHELTERTVLALDIGTNTEVCLAHNGTLSSLSCASGPAFEGAHIKHGMRAAKGAIERVRFTEGVLEYQTIGHAPAVGICGSGILDALAQLTRAGVVRPNGRLTDGPRVRGEKAQREYLLVEESGGRPAITFAQKDVRELQLAKGAIRTGVDVLLQSQNLTPEHIDQVIIAGAFGSYIDVDSAVAVGMLPELPLDRFRQVGNAAGMGAKLALISQAKRAEAAELARRVRYIELATAPNFSQIFARSMLIG